MQTSNRSVSLKNVVRIVVVLSMVFTVASMGLYQYALSTAYTGDVTEKWYTPSQEASYVVGLYNSTHYFLQNHTGYGLAAYEGYEFLSTNASAVIESCSTANTTIYFKEGQYAINNLLPVNQSGMRFIGSGWGTQFTIGTTGGFNISNTAALNDISFENIRWIDASGGSGAGTSAYGITSAMPAQMRISHFKFSGNRVDYFRKAGTIFLDLVNLEVSTIENNYFYRTTTAFIQLSAYLYECGNVWFNKNVFYFGYDAANENAIRITVNNGNSTFQSVVSNVFSHNNQWYAEASYDNSAVAWNLTLIGSYTKISSLDCQGDRYEHPATVLISTGVSSSYASDRHYFSGNDIYNTVDDSILFQLKDWTREVTIENNRIDMTGSNVSALKDYNTPSGANWTLVNKFVNNRLGTTSIFVNGSYGTVVYGNMNYNPIGYVANWKATESTVSPYNGYAATFTNLTTYTVRTCPIQFNVTGGTGINGAEGVNITICDANNYAFINNASSLYWFYMPIGYTITCVYASVPTAVVIFD